MGSGNPALLIYKDYGRHILNRVMAHKKYICNACKNKPFFNFLHNGIHLSFPNGNHASIIWGMGSYTENHYKFEIGLFTTFMGSNTVEAMFDCSKRRQKEIFKHFKVEDQPIGHIKILEFLWLLNKLAE